MAVTGPCQGHTRPDLSRGCHAFSDVPCFAQVMELMGLSGVRVLRVSGYGEDGCEVVVWRPGIEAMLHHTRCALCEVKPHSLFEFLHDLELELVV